MTFSETYPGADPKYLPNDDDLAVGALYDGPQRIEKLPVQMEAVQLLWRNWGAICDFAGVGPEDGQPHGVWVDPDTGEYGDEPTGGRSALGLVIPTLEGDMLARHGDWIMRGVKGELYPCKPEVFAEIARVLGPA